MAVQKYLAIPPSRGGRAISWLGFGIYDYAAAAGFNKEVLRLEAQDGCYSQGILYSAGGERTVVCFMHPRGDFSGHYCIPELTKAGYAVFGQLSRFFNNDTACVHEMLCADVAASISELRKRGFEHVVLVGNSGGGSLYSLYQSQATIAPPGRITTTPAGDTFDLNAFDLPSADALVLLAAHPGEGKFLMSIIDPSVVDEGDPDAVDPSLDMYDPANGYRVPPEASSYTAEFLSRYRIAQRRRVERIDAIARKRIAEMRRYEMMVGAADFEDRPVAEQLAIRRKAATSAYITTYRTDANPVCCDPTIEPSSRAIGSVLGPRPDITNYQVGGFGAVTTPEAWLSTWSGVSSHGRVIDNLAHVKVPFCLINFTGDCVVLASEIAAMYDSVASQDKQVVHVEGDHYGADKKGTLAPRTEASLRLVEWLIPRFQP